MDEVLVGADIVDIWPCIGIPLSLQVVKSGGVAQNEFDMEFEKHGDDAEKGDLDEESNHADDGVNAQRLLAGEDLDNFGYFEWQFDSDGEDESQDDVEEEEHEEFPVAEPHAVGNPRTVVVHVQNASLAGRAVMASLLS